MQITLPDGQTRDVPDNSTGLAIAESIAKSLAKAALAIKVNGDVKDLAYTITGDARIEIVTRDHPDALELLRHDAAHVMAEAVKELYPETQVTIGPAIENGFYYDFHREMPFTPDDLPIIEKRMRDIVARNETITREEWARDTAIAYFKQQGEHFKAELIAGIPGDQAISVYRQGQFLDLCRGPHLPNTGKLGTAFKLMKIAGAYWRGDSTQPMLQRIYGTAWANQEQLDAHLKMLKEAEKRDHRRLGREMGLLHFQEEAPGSIFWHPKGWALYQALESYIKDKMRLAGYQEVRTPILLDQTFWQCSGHWDKFRENMFVSEAEDRVYAVKPMNCPGHVQIFKQGIKSYRDLPIRLAEFNNLHRYEPSGALHGLMRLRSFHQDDAHIFCREDQINDEAKAFCDLLKTVYTELGFTDVAVKFSDRPVKRAGDDADWDKAEAALREAAEKSGLEFTLNPGEGAFYGPKLEFTLRDAIGREWQCGTLQCDFILPQRLGATYIAEDGQKHRPVMLHRAILGSLERFLGILIEHTAGHLPFWLAPVQVVVTTITSEANDYAQQVFDTIQQAGLRSDIDLRNEKISYKIREHSLAKVPVILTVGKQEMEQETVSIRRLGSQGQEVMALEACVQDLIQAGRH